jgi:DNA-binding MarR family transcriptional regulator
MSRHGLKDARRIVDGVATFRGPLVASRRTAPIPESLKRYAGFVLIVAAHGVEARYARAAHDVGISLRDFVLLAEIAQRPGLSQATLARRVGIARSRVSEQLAVLDTAGYVERELDIRDLRRRRIWITYGGQAALEDAAQRLQEIDNGWLASLKPAERHQFTASLRRVPPTETRRTQWSSATSAGRP